MIYFIKTCFPSLSASLFFFFSSRRRHTRYIGDWSSDVCSSDLPEPSCPACPPRDRGEGFFLRCLLRFALAAGPSEPGGIDEFDESIPTRRSKTSRSEERRVGKEGRSRRSWDPMKTKMLDRHRHQ